MGEMNALEHFISRLDGLPKHKTLRAIVSEVAREYGLDHDAMVGPDRSRALAHPRQEAMRRAHLAGYSMPQIGKALGGRNHTTVLHGIRQARKRMQE